MAHGIPQSGDGFGFENEREDHSRASKYSANSNGNKLFGRDAWPCSSSIEIHPQFVKSRVDREYSTMEIGFLYGNISSSTLLGMNT